jgi:hypothetical protein
VNVNSIAAGIAEESFLRLITNSKIVPYLYLDLKELTLRTYSKQRDPNCHACSSIRDYDVELTGSELFDDQSEEDNRREQSAFHDMNDDD